MTTVLNTTNPEYITWQYEQLQVTLLGGLRIEGMDRMRVTIKVEYKRLCTNCHLQGFKICTGVDYESTPVFLQLLSQTYKGIDLMSIP